MIENTAPSEQAIRNAYDQAGDVTKRVLAKLWPWVASHRFHEGETVRCNDGTEAVVLGYSDNSEALRYFKSLPNAPSYEMGFRVLMINANGCPRWSKEQNLNLGGNT